MIFWSPVSCINTACNHVLMSSRVGDINLTSLFSAVHETGVPGARANLLMQGISKRVENVLNYWYWTIDDWMVHKAVVQAL